MGIKVETKNSECCCVGCDAVYSRTINVVSKKRIAPTKLGGGGVPFF